MSVFPPAQMIHEKQALTNHGKSHKLHPSHFPRTAVHVGNFSGT